MEIAGNNYRPVLLYSIDKQRHGQDAGTFPLSFKQDLNDSRYNFHLSPVSIIEI